MHKVSLWRVLFASYIIIIGLIILVQNLAPQVAVWAGFWPLLILIPGIYIMLHFVESHPSQKKPYEYIFGLFLIIFSLFLFFNQFTGWFYYDLINFVLPLTLTIPMLLAWLRWQKKWMFDIGLIFFLVSGFWLLYNLHYAQYFYALVVILVGLSLFERKKVR
ncbi:MAG: hypothetical protein WC773_02415 [Patescibacteria group bacterium]